MATLTVEITDSLKDRLEHELASGHVKDRNALVQLLLEAGMHARWLADAEAKIQESFRDIERGDVGPWKSGDATRFGLKYFADKRAKEGRS